MEPGEQQRHRGAAVQFTLHADLASQFLHVLIALVSTDAHAGSLGGLERFEEPILNEILAHAAAGIGDADTRLAALGIRAGTIDQATVRFVTHKDVDDADLDRAIAALDKVVER